MEFGTGAMSALLPKLGLLLKEEYDLQKGVKDGVKFLMAELESMHAALEKVSDVPADQLDKQVKLWARDVREMSYDIDDIVDTFLVRMEGRKTGYGRRTIKGIIYRCRKSVSMFKERHKIAIDIRGIKALVCGAKERRDRYNVDGVVRPATTSVDPRLSAMFKKVTELVGVEERRDELIKMLSKGDQVSSKNLKIVSIAGLGGLGKTTLAKVVYDKLKIEFKCSAFVSVGQNPDVRKVLKDILFQLDKKKYEDIHDRTRDEKQLIDLLWQFLGKKRYASVHHCHWMREG